MHERWGGQDPWNPLNWWPLFLWSNLDGRDLGNDLQRYTYQGRSFLNGGAYGNYVPARVLTAEWGIPTTIGALSAANALGFFQTYGENRHDGAGILSSLGAAAEVTGARISYQFKGIRDEVSDAITSLFTP